MCQLLKTTSTGHPAFPFIMGVDMRDRRGYDGNVIQHSLGLAVRTQSSYGEDTETRNRMYGQRPRVITGDRTGQGVSLHQLEGYARQPETEVVWGAGAAAISGGNLLTVPECSPSLLSFFSLGGRGAIRVTHSQSVKLTYSNEIWQTCRGSQFQPASPRPPYNLFNLVPAVD